MITTTCPVSSTTRSTGTMIPSASPAIEIFGTVEGARRVAKEVRASAAARLKIRVDFGSTGTDYHPMTMYERQRGPSVESHVVIHAPAFEFLMPQWFGLYLICH